MGAVVYLGLSLPWREYYYFHLMVASVSAGERETGVMLLPKLIYSSGLIVGDTSRSLVTSSGVMERN